MTLASTAVQQQGFILTHFEAIMGGLAALATAVTALALGLRWTYQQGASSAKLVNSIDVNTLATTELSAAFKTFTEKTDGTLTDHERRVTRLEDRQAIMITDVSELKGTRDRAGR